MVLLDSEGTDAVTSEGYDNSQIFTLAVLLSSVLIYNSTGVPTRTDREGLKYPLNYIFFFIFRINFHCIGLKKIMSYDISVNFESQ